MRSSCHDIDTQVTHVWLGRHVAGDAVRVRVGSGEVAGLVAVDLDHDHVGLRATQAHVDVAHLEHHRATHRCLTRLGDGTSGAEPEQLKAVADGWIAGSIHGADLSLIHI